MSSYNKTIRVNKDLGKTNIQLDRSFWNSTMVRYDKSASTMVIEQDRSLFLPSTIAFKASPPPTSVETNKLEEVQEIVRNILSGDSAYVDGYLKPIPYALNSGDYVSEYQVQKKIGEGSFSKVYEVCHSFRKKIEAIKILDHFGGNAISIDQYYFEYQIGQLESDFILRSKDRGFYHGNPYIVFEIANGGDLGKLKFGKIDIDLVDYLGEHILLGLKDLHSTGIIHRDIKPQNIFICNNTFKIGDFGVSTLLDRVIALPNSLVGTYGYLAPELLDNKEFRSNPDVRQDLFSFGCMMFEVLTGVLPFGKLTKGDDIDHYNYNAKNSIYRPLRQIRKDIPSYWEDIIYGCIQSDLQDRYSSVSDLLGLLKSSTAKFGESSKKISTEVYDFDLVLSFPENNRFVALELLAFFKNKGVKVFFNSNVFGDLIDNIPFESAKYHVIINLGTTDLAYIEEMSKLHGGKGIVIYGNTEVRAKFEGREKVLIAESKDQILKIVEGWKEKIEDVSKPQLLKAELLGLVAKNKIGHVVKHFLDHLNSIDGNEDVKIILYNLSSRLKSLKTDILNGVINADDARIEESKIVYGLNVLIFDYF